MKIRRVEVENFKGIKSADWRIPSDKSFFCLVGPGDSGKSSLLEAMHLALSDRWNLSISDTDFYEGDTTKPITIRVTVSDLPNEIQQHNVLGFHLSGVNGAGDYQHDPTSDFTACVIIQLKLDKDVEPSWSIFRPDADGDPVAVGAGIRRKFNVFKVDDRIDIQLRWSKASALSRLTDATHGTSGTLATAIRAARDAVFSSVTPELKALAKKIQGEVNALGGGDFKDLRPGLDNSLTTSGGNLALFEGNVPLTNFGLGTKRIAGIATQELAVSDGAILIIDEVEHGLEPHRLVHLLRHLKRPDSKSQVFVTTHSPVAVEQLEADDLVVVRSEEGQINAHSVPSSLKDIQGGLRSGPSSFLARRVIVTEGKTEHGLLLGLLQQWDDDRASTGQAPSAALGVAIRDGRGGSTAASRAKLLRELGYETALFMDNDVRSDDAAVKKAYDAGVQVIQWDHGLATEDQLVQDASDSLLNNIVLLACTPRIDEQTVIDDLSRMAGSHILGNLDVSTWCSDGTLSLEDARHLVARTAKKYDWFKNVYNGKTLATHVLAHWDEYAGTRLEEVLLELKGVIYGEGPKLPLVEDPASA